MLAEASFESALPLFVQTQTDPAVLVELYNPQLCLGLKTRSRVGATAKDLPMEDQLPPYVQSFAHIGMLAVWHFAICSLIRCAVAVAVHKKYAGNPSAHVEALEAYRRRIMHNALGFLVQYCSEAKRQRIPTELVQCMPW